MDLKHLKQYLKNREKQQAKQAKLHKVHDRQKDEKTFSVSWIKQHGFHTFHDLKDPDWQRLKQDFAKYESEKDAASQKANQADQDQRYTKNAQKDMSPKDVNKHLSKKDKQKRNSLKKARALSHDPEQRHNAQLGMKKKAAKRVIDAEMARKEQHRAARLGNKKAKQSIARRREATVRGIPGVGVRPTAKYLDKHLFKKLPHRTEGFAGFLNGILAGIGRMNKKALDDPLLDAFSPIGFKRIITRRQKLNQARAWQQEHPDQTDEAKEQRLINSRARKLNHAKMNHEDDLQE